MNKALDTLLAVVCLGMTMTPMAFATIRVSSEPTPIQVDGAAEIGGIITFRFNVNDFRSASAEEPYYVRLRLDKGTTLAETLVDIESNGGSPINLPVYLKSFRPGYRVIAPENTVQIARWKADEPEIWLAFNASSRDLLLINGEAPTNSSNILEFQIGIAPENASNSPGSAILFRGWSNLVGPTRVSDGQLVGTQLKLNLKDSILKTSEDPDTTFGEDLVYYDPIAFNHITSGVRTAESPSGIFIGVAILVAWSGRNEIAFGDRFSDPRWIHHLTEAGTAVRSSLNLENTTSRTRTNELTLYRLDGSEIGIHEVTLASREFLQLDEMALTAIFGEMPSHIRLDGHQFLQATTHYAMALDPNISTQWPAMRSASNILTFYSVNFSDLHLLFAVNRGVQGANVDLVFIDANNVETGRVSLATMVDFPAGSKNAWNPGAFALPATTTGFRLESSQPLGAVFLTTDSAGSKLFTTTPLMAPQ